MKKILITVMVFITVSLISTVACATDTATKISLDDRARLTVSMQSNSLVFSNEPTDITYDSISFYILNSAGSTVRNVTYNRGQGNNATIDLKGLTDGSYKLSVINKAPGYKKNTNSYAFTVEVKGGNASFKAGSSYAANLKKVAHERTDAYALDFLKVKFENAGADTNSSVYSNVNIKGKLDVLVNSYGSFKVSDAVYVKQANIIIAGITDDYLKVKAIHDWVANNMYYDYPEFNNKPIPFGDADSEVFYGAGLHKRGVCADYANVTTGLCQAAGFPAKYVVGTADGLGGWGGHAWTEVYVDNRWVFLDITWDSQNSFNGKYSEKQQCTETYFDMPIVQWSVTHKLDSNSISVLDNNAWTGSLYIIDVSTNNVLKEIKNYTIGGLVTSTYGYNAKDMYSDMKCTKHWNFATDKVSTYSSRIFVKTYIVTFYMQDVIATINLQVQASSKLAKPATPTRKGYKFVNWYKDNRGTKVWNFATDKITENITLYAGWKKK